MTSFRFNVKFFFLLSFWIFFGSYVLVFLAPPFFFFFFFFFFETHFFLWKPLPLLLSRGLALIYLGVFFFFSFSPFFFFLLGANFGFQKNHERAGKESFRTHREWIQYYQKNSF